MESEDNESGCDHVRLYYGASGGWREGDVSVTSTGEGAAKLMELYAGGGISNPGLPVSDTY